MKVVANSKWGADKLHFSIFIALYCPILAKFGCIVYGSTRTFYLKALDAKHYKCLWLIVGTHGWLREERSVINRGFRRWPLAMPGSFSNFSIRQFVIGTQTNHRLIYIYSNFHCSTLWNLKHVSLTLHLTVFFINNLKITTKIKHVLNQSVSEFCRQAGG